MFRTPKIAPSPPPEKPHLSVAAAVLWHAMAAEARRRCELVPACRRARAAGRPAPTGQGPYLPPVAFPVLAGRTAADPAVACLVGAGLIGAVTIESTDDGEAVRRTDGWHLTARGCRALREFDPARRRA